VFGLFGQGRLMGGSALNITPSELHSSGSTLQNFGDQVAAGGDKLQTIGDQLVAHAGKDKSGVGSVIAKALGTGTKVAGKVFSEGGRVAGAAGSRLHGNASAHEENEAHQTGVFKGIHGDGADEHTPTAKSEPGGPSGTSDPGPGDKTPGKPPAPHPDEGGPGPDLKSGNGDPAKNATPPTCRPGSGDPIDMTTGQMMMTQVDATIEGVLPLVVTRTHLSGYRFGRWFGAAWASTVDARIEVDADGVQFATDEGALLAYPAPLPGREVLPEFGPRWPLLETEEGIRISAPERHRSWLFGPAGTLAAIVDDGGARIDLGYAEDGTLTELWHSAGYRVAVATANNRISALSLTDDAGTEVPLIRYHYDDAGQLTGIVDSTGVAWQFGYDDAGRVNHWQDRSGQWYRYEFDEQGRCVRGEGSGGFLNATFGWDAERRINTSTDSLGNTTTYELNEFWQVVRETDPLGGTTLSEWNRAGQLLARVDPLGRTTRYEYGPDENLTAVIRPDGSRAELDRIEHRTLTVTVGDAVRTYAAPDLPDPLAEQVGVAGSLDEDTDAADPFDGVTEQTRTGLPAATEDGQRFQRDLFGRPRVVTDARGGRTLFDWTVEGNLTRRQDPSGATTYWRYDNDGNEVERLDPAGGLVRTERGPFDLVLASTDQTGARTTYTYDTELRRTSVTNPAGATWHYRYDAAGRLVEEADFDGRVSRVDYDAAGQVTSTTNAAGQTVEYDYDVLGNVIARRADGGTTTFGYDPVGRLVAARSPEAELTIVREPDGRVLAQSVNDRTIAFDYSLDRHTKIRRTPAGTTSTWSFESVVDGALRATLSTSGHELRFEHGPEDRELLRQLDDTVVLRQFFDAAGRLGEQEVGATRRGYDYRPDGQLIAVRDEAGQRFHLDAVGRIIEYSSAERTESYRYDGTGNITTSSATGGTPPPTTGPRSYAGNQLTAAGADTFGYDEQGRLVERVRTVTGGAALTWRYAWNSLDRLTDLHTPDGAHWHYRYDPLGRRIAKQRLVDGQVAEQVEFAWDGTTLVEQVHTGADGQVTVLTWEHHPDDNRVVSQVEWTPAGEHRFATVITDGIGTPLDVIGSDGALLWHADSTVWGHQPAGSAVPQPLRFPGQYHDAESGLHYNVYRYYDPSTGRYVSPDPLGLEPAPDPLAYVPNPFTAADPLGLSGRGVGCGGSGDGSGSGGTKRKRDDADNAAGSSSAPPSKRPNQGAQWTTSGGGTTSGEHTFKDGLPAYGSPPKAGHVTDVEKLNQAPQTSDELGDELENGGLQLHEKWIKGHLQNDNLGGQGVSHNMTPLTSTANKRMSSRFEGRIKQAVQRPPQIRATGPRNAQTLINQGYSPAHAAKIMDGINNLGVKYEVKTSDGVKFPNSEFKHEQGIRDHLIINTSYTGTTPEFNQWMSDTGRTLPTLPPPNTTMDTITGDFTPHHDTWMKK
jgi:RHS repeat-associated protein